MAKTKRSLKTGRKSAYKPIKLPNNGKEALWYSPEQDFLIVGSFLIGGFSWEYDFTVIDDGGTDFNPWSLTYIGDV